MPAPHHSRTSPAEDTVVIVLGAAVWPGGEASPTLRRRAEHGARCFLSSGAALLVTTGGIGRHGPSEAAVAAAICVDAGVPPGAVLREDRSTNTLDNLRFARALLERAPGRVLIVTDYYHAPRALLTARMLGMRAGVSVPGRPLAQIRPAQHLRAILRESLALPAYALRLLRDRWRR